MSTLMDLGALRWAHCSPLRPLLAHIPLFGDMYLKKVLYWQGPMAKGLTSGGPKRLPLLDSAKGFAILLVVIGHVPGRTRPADAEWYNAVYQAIYLFHMPLFMFISGMLFGLSRSIEKAESDYGQFVAARAERLLLPFAVIGLIAILTKYMGSMVTTVHGAPSDLLSGLLDTVIFTSDSPAIFVWYVAVLFIFSALTPALFVAFKRNEWALLFLGMVLYFLPVPELFYLNRAANFFVFFAAGICAALHLNRVHEWRWTGPIFVVAFAMSILVFVIWGRGNPLGLLVTGLLSAPAIFYVLQISKAHTSSTLLTLGRYAFIIYLLNVFFLGGARSLGQAILPWDGINFLLFLVVLTIVGVLGPILFKRIVLSHIPPLDRLTN